VHHSSDGEQQEVVSSKCLLPQIQMSLFSSRSDSLVLYLHVLLVNNCTGLQSNLTRISGVEVLFSTCAEVCVFLGGGGEKGEFCPSAKCLQSYDIYLSAFIHSEIWR